MKHLLLWSLTAFIFLSSTAMHRISVLKSMSQKTDLSFCTTNRIPAKKHMLQKELDKNWEEFKKNSKDADSWKVTMAVCADFGCNNSCKARGVESCSKMYDMLERNAKQNALALHALKKEIDQLDIQKSLEK